MGKAIRTTQEITYASDIFTDRQAPRDAFWKMYDKVKQEMSNDEIEARVLTYYGLGGIGKSSLLKKLEEELEEKETKPLYIKYDFNDETAMQNVLYSLRNSLVNKYKFSFPLFDFAMYHYAQKSGVNMESPEVKSIIDNSDFLDATFSVLGMIPVVATAAEIVQCVDKGQVIVRNFFKKFDKESKEIARLEKNDLRKLLPLFFAKDMNENLKKIDKPFVIMLDTYEQLVNEMSSVGEPWDNDLWLREEKGLILNIPKVLWVIAGREKIKWDDFLHEGWGDSLEQHILGDLSDQDTNTYLESVEIRDEKLKTDLYKLTNGTPVYLDICAKRYQELIKMNIEPDISEFGHNIRTLIERFVRYMDDNRKDMVHMLACMEKWTDEMVLEIMPDIYPAFSMSLYEKVKGFSFVFTNDAKKYHLQESIGKVLIEDAPLELKKKVYEGVAKYAIKKCKVTSPVLDDYAFYLLKINHVLTFYTKTYGEEDVKTLLLMEETAKAMEKAGEYETALDVQYLIYNIRMELFGPLHPDTLRVLNAAGVLYKKMGDYDQAFRRCRSAYEKYLEINGENDLSTIEARINMADILRLYGKYRDALQIYAEEFVKYENVYGEEDEKVIDMIYHLARCYSEVQEPEEANSLYEVALYRYENLLGSEHIKTLEVRNAMAKVFVDMKNYQVALSHYKQIYEICRKKMGALHPNTLTAMYNMALVFGSSDDLRECYDLLMETFELRNMVLGTYHPDTRRVAEMLLIIESRL